MTSTLRIIDANANRAREALRVMEEAARFVLDDALLTSDFKRLRHDLRDTLNAFPALQLHRDTPGDVGTGIGTRAESERDSIASVARAAGKRLSEAMRAIEEYGKLVDPAFASRVEQLRYRGYELEQRLASRLIAFGPRQWRVCVLLTESLCTHHSWWDVFRASIDGGADCIQLREKELDDGQLIDRAHRQVEAAPDGVSIIINDRPDIALLCGAHGVHLGQGDLAVADVRKLAGRQLIVGVSTSRIDQAKRAMRDGADYCGVGPVFPSATKPKPELAGLDYLRAYLNWGRLPHLAISGITPDNVEALIDAGCRGVAVSSCVCGARDPANVVTALRTAFDMAPIA